MIKAAFFDIDGTLIPHGKDKIPASTLKSLTLLKEKGAMLISGFNTLSKEERELYDQKQLSLDQRNVFLTYAGILSFGAFLSCLIDDHLSYVALIVWLFVFFKGVHIDTEKAFGKYKRN